jgi:hypothetical protein
VEIHFIASTGRHWIAFLDWASTSGDTDAEIPIASGWDYEELTKKNNS